MAARQAYDGALSRNDGAAPFSVGRDRGRKPIAVGIAAAGDRYSRAGSKPDGTRMDGDGGGRGVAERARDGRTGLAVYRSRLGSHRTGRGPGDLAGRQLWIAAARSRRDAGQARGPRAPTGSGAVVPPPRGVGFAGFEDAFHRPRRVPARHGRVVPETLLENSSPDPLVSHACRDPDGQETCWSATHANSLMTGIARVRSGCSATPAASRYSPIGLPAPGATVPSLRRRWITCAGAVVPPPRRVAGSPGSRTPSTGLAGCRHGTDGVFPKPFLKVVPRIH